MPDIKEREMKTLRLKCAYLESENLFLKDILKQLYDDIENLKIDRDEKDYLAREYLSIWRKEVKESKETKK